MALLAPATLASTAEAASQAAAAAPAFRSKCVQSPQRPESIRKHQKTRLGAVATTAARKSAPSGSAHCDADGPRGATSEIPGPLPDHCSPALTRRSLSLLAFSGAAVTSALVIPNPLHSEELSDASRGSNGQLACAVEDDDEDLPSLVFQVCTPSVAAVLLYLQKYPNEEGILEGTGSGFVWDKYGHIVTNYHVVSKYVDDKSGLVSCMVKLLNPNGSMVQHLARVVGIDPSKDLAVLRVDDAAPEELSPATIGSSGDLRVGQSCFALGNPYGYLHTLTAGVVSGLGRAIPSPTGQAISGAIQTDAAINAGNSGGPLLDSSGRVIGINTATFSRKGSGTSSGVNFAIPIDTVVQVVPQVIVYGTPTRAYNAYKR